MPDYVAAVFFPTTLVDGFSKLWLRGKGILGVETLIPGISVPVAGAHPVPVVKNDTIYQVF